MSPKKYSSKPSKNTKTRSVIIGGEMKKIGASETKNNANEKPDDMNNKVAVWTEILGWATVALALVGVATVITLSCQVHEMRIENKLEQRAWVVPLKIITPNENPYKRFEITFQNTGKTPALEVNGWTVFDDSLNWEEGMKKPWPIKALIPPNGTITSDPFSNEICPIASTVKARASEKPTFFFGKIWYRDIFGGNHWLEFSYQIIGILDADKYMIRPWGDHNKTDDKPAQQ